MINNIAFSPIQATAKFNAATNTLNIRLCVPAASKRVMLVQLVEDVATR
jgi:hypothetical protein